MIRRRALAAVLVLVLALAAPSAGAASAGGTLLRGYHLYAGNCVSCHGSNGDGVSQATAGANGTTGLGPSLRGVGALAANFYLREGFMPLRTPYDQPRRSRSPFTDADIRALVAYVASLGGGPPIPHPHPERGSLSEGLELFTENCAGCHQVVAQGGYVTGAVAPPLNYDDAVEIASAVRIGPYIMPRFSKRQLSDRQLDSIVRYVLHSQHPTDPGGWGIAHVGPVPEGLITWLVAAAALVATCVVIGRRLT